MAKKNMALYKMDLIRLFKEDPVFGRMWETGNPRDTIFLSRVKVYLHKKRDGKWLSKWLTGRINFERKEFARKRLAVKKSKARKKKLIRAKVK